MTQSEPRTFIVSYRQILAGSTCVLGAHALAWAVWKQVVDIPFAPWVGLVQTLYVIPLYFGASARSRDLKLGVKRAGQVTAAAWAFYVVLLLLGMFGGSK